MRRRQVSNLSAKWNLHGSTQRKTGQRWSIMGFPFQVDASMMIKEFDEKRYPFLGQIYSLRYSVKRDDLLFFTINDRCNRDSFQVFSIMYGRQAGRSSPRARIRL
jgi:hypothetical protein